MAEIFDFKRREGGVTASTSGAAVVNLWVKREELRREADWNQLLWTCSCGSRVFNWYRVHGLRCDACGKKTTPPR